MIKEIKVTWHSKEERPVFIQGGDNRIIACARLQTISNPNVCYMRILPDGRIINTEYVARSDKWINKHAIEWDNLMCDWWAYVTDIIPKL